MDISDFDFAIPFPPFLTKIFQHSICYSYGVTKTRWERKWSVWTLELFLLNIKCSPITSHELEVDLTNASCF